MTTPVSERENMDPDEVRAAMEPVEEGDKIVFNDKKRPLTVDEVDGYENQSNWPK